MNILHISCSPGGQASESYRLSQAIVDYLRERTPGACVSRRMLDGSALPPVDAPYALALGAAQEPADESPAGSSRARSDALIDELEGADALVIGTPMHNLSVPSVLKAWIDHVVRVNRTFDITRDGKVGRLADRPVLIAVASGGLYSGETARQPDFLTLYLKAILATIGLRDLRFYSVEGMAFGADAAALAHQRTLQRLDGDLSLAA